MHLAKMAFVYIVYAPLSRCVTLSNFLSSNQNVKPVMDATNEMNSFTLTKNINHYVLNKTVISKPQLHTCYFLFINYLVGVF